MYRQGKIIDSAAGNEGNIITCLFDDPNTPHYDVVPVPAAIPSSFTVAATDEVDARTWFSNYGTSRLKYVDIAKALGRTLTGIQGQIIDAENPNWFYNILGGVRVSVGARSAFSNDGGFYTITGLRPGTYTITVSKGGYVTQTRTVTVRAGEITEDVDFYMVRTKPTRFLTVVTTWNQYNPGFLEWLVSSKWCWLFICGLEHPDFPRVEDVAGRGMDINLRIMPDDIRMHPIIYPGSLYDYPRAKVIVDSWWVERPFDTLVYRPVSGKTYDFGVQMPPSLYWGKIAGSGAVTRIFRGTSVISTISSATAAGTADFWWHVCRQSGTGTPSPVSRRILLYGFTPVSGSTIILVDDDGSGWWGGGDYSGWYITALMDAEYKFAY